MLYSWGAMMRSGWPWWKRLAGAYYVLTGACVAVGVKQPRNEVDANFRTQLIREVPGVVSANFWENYGMYRLYLELVHGSVVYVTLDHKIGVGVKDSLAIDDMGDYDIICRMAADFSRV